MEEAEQDSRLIALWRFMERTTAVHVVVLLFGAYRLIWRALIERPPLTETQLEAPSLVGQALAGGRITWVIAIVLLPLLVGTRRLRWHAIDAQGRIRVFVFVLAVIVGWAGSTYGHNLFFDQAHHLDRLILVVLTLLVWVHPTFAAAQVMVAIVLLGQLMFPLAEGHWHWPDKRLPFDCLILFVGFLFVRLVFRARPVTYLYGVIVLTSATYGHAALEKMRLGPQAWSWAIENQLSHIMLAAHTNGGWLRGFGTEQVVAWARKLASLEPLPTLATLAIELSPLLLLVFPRSARIVVPALISMHVSILLTTGIFFWKWILLLVALWWTLERLERDRALARSLSPALAPASAARAVGRFRWPLVAIGLAAVLFGASTLRLVPFAWADSPVSNFFVIRGIGASGATYRLEPRHFAPYDILLTQSRFDYLTREPVLVGTYGTTGEWALLQALERATPEDLHSIRAVRSPGSFNARKSKRFSDFVVRSVETMNRRGGQDNGWSTVAPPFHFQTSMPENAYRFEEPIRRVTVTFEEWFFDGTTLTRTRELPVLDLPIPDEVESRDAGATG